MKYVPEGHFHENVKCCKIALTMIGSTYVCEAGFSAMNNIKYKKRNSLTDEHLENLLRAAVTRSASDQKSRCNTPESNFSVTFYDKTAGTLVSSRPVELQVF